MFAGRGWAIVEQSGTFGVSILSFRTVDSFSRRRGYTNAAGCRPEVFGDETTLAGDQTTVTDSQRCRLATGGCRLAAGRCRLVAGQLKLIARSGCLAPSSGCLTAGEPCLATSRRCLAARQPLLEAGKRQLTPRKQETYVNLIRIHTWPSRKSPCRENSRALRCRQVADA